MIPSAGCISSHIPEIEIYSRIELRPNLPFRTNPSKVTVERLLAEIWVSGFLDKTETVRREILNNSYGIFWHSSELQRDSGAKAYFLREEGRNDRVMLSRCLFRGFHLDPSLGACRRLLYSGTKATIIHELFHDFWFNLIDEEQRECFRRESRKLFLAGRETTTAAAKLDFLSRMGLKDPMVSDFDPYAEILLYQDEYEEARFFGTEVYALIAEMAYTGKIRVPASLRAYYDGILSQQALSGNPVSLRGH